MLKHLILPALALTLSLAAHAQAQAGLAFDYEHIQSPRLQNLGPGSGQGGSAFIYFPLKHNFGFDLSLDIAGGHTSFDYYPFSPTPTVVPQLTTIERSFTYSAIPVHIVYNWSFPHLRLFVGAGAAFTHLSMEELAFHGWSLAPNCNTLSLSLKGGLELLRHLVFSSEFRPLNAVVSKNGQYQYYSYSVSSLLSLKLGYAFGNIRPIKHSAPTHSDN
ncbi:MAG: hypothetical protein JST42_14880 [Bacteroidetes bacterium]|nr:hypothetical protein [Bacteroidota bacterium]